MALVVLLAFGAGAEEVAAGYTRLAYLDAAAGNCWIDLGIPAATGWRVDLEINPLVTTGDWKIFGCANGISVGQINSKWRFGNGWKDASKAISATHYVLTVYTPGYDGNYANGLYRVDDDVLANYVSASTLNLTVFGWRESASKVICAPQRFHALRITSSAGVIHEYLPARRDSDGTLGIYDTKTLSFLTNGGTGTLTAGPDYVASTIKIGTLTYTSIEDAYEAASATAATVIELTQGSDPIRLSYDRLLIEKPVILRGMGATPDDTVVKPARRYADAFFFTVSNETARIENLTLAEGKNARENNETSGDAPIIVHSGTIANCVIRNFSGSGRYGAVRMSGGTIRDSSLLNNMLYTGVNGSVGYGGGITMQGGAPFVTNCVITGCRCNIGGGGVYMASIKGRMIGCTITANTVASQGSGLYISAGTVEDCVITANGPASSYGSGVCLGNNFHQRGETGTPVLRRCLIADNTSVNNYTGVYMARGILENCTIVNNASTSASSGGIFQSGGTIANCLFALNQGTGATASLQNFSRTGGTLTNCVSEAEIPSGGTVKDNQVGTINFTDPLAKDYHLAPGCVATHAGCYPYAPGKVSCAAEYDLQMHDGEEPIQFTARVDGSDLTGLTYAWDFDGDGVVDSTEANPKWSNPPYGEFSPLLTVKNANGDTATASTQTHVLVVPSTVYVSQEGSGTFPFDTWEKATNDVEVALAAVCATEAKPGTIYVGTGTYQVASFWIQLTKPIRVLGKGPDKTVFRAYNGGKDYRRVMLVNHAQAFVSGVNLTDGRLYNGGEGYYTDDGAGPGGLRLISGIVTNCWISDCKGSHNCGGVEVQDGWLVDCQIFRCWAGRNNNGSTGSAGGVLLKGGLVENCIISNNYAQGAGGDSGGGAQLLGGTLRGSKILNNYGGSYNNRRGAGIALGAGLVDRCEIAGGYNCTYGAGVFMGKITDVTTAKVTANGTGTLRNCLIRDNMAQSEGAGVYMPDGSGTIEHCTIVANTSLDSLSGGLYQGAGTVRNTIIYDNGDPASVPVCNVNFVKGTLFDYNISTPAVTGTNVGTNNLTDAPGFADSGHGDYSLATGSPAIDSALPIAAVTNDLVGAHRPKQGSEASAEAISDRGCYEALAINEGPFRCSILYSVPVSGMQGLVVTYTAKVGGSGMDGAVTYEWDYTGGTKIDGAADDQWIKVRYDNYGRYGVSLKATNEDGDEADMALDELIAIGASPVYISHAGANIWPYATWETAATNVIEAFNSLVLSAGESAEIIVDDGTYPIDDLWVKITAPIYFHSANGPEHTTLVANNSVSNYKRVVMVNNEDAVCEGFTMTGGSCYNNTNEGAGPGALRLLAGTVRNCIIRDNLGADNSGGVDMRGGTLENCIVIRNASWRDNNGLVADAGGIRISAGPARVIGCVIADNWTRMSGGGIYVNQNLSGVVVSNCVISGNSSGSAYGNRGDLTGVNGSGIYALSGIFTHNIITGNTCVAYAASPKKTGEGAVHVGGSAELRNSLIAKNLSYWGAQGIYLGSANAKVVNCTATENGSDSYEYKDPANTFSSRFVLGTLANTLVWGDHGGLAPSIADTVSKSHNWTESNPFFRRPARGDWHLLGNSPCVNAGDNGYVTEPTDLGGNPRRCLIVDIGCYETPDCGFILLVR